MQRRLPEVSVLLEKIAPKSERRKTRICLFQEIFETFSFYFHLFHVSYHMKVLELSLNVRRFKKAAIKVCRMA